MGKRTRSYAPVHVAPLRARRIRGPRSADEPDVHYWRITLDHRVDGKEVTVGSCAWLHVDQVTDELIARRVQARREESTRTDGTIALATVQDLCEWAGWRLALRMDIADSTRVKVRAALRMVRRTIGHVSLDAFDQATLDRCRDLRLREVPRTCRGKPMSERGTVHPSTVKTELAIWLGIWREAADLGVVPTVPLRAPRFKTNAGPRNGNGRYTPTAAEVAQVTARLRGWTRTLLLLQWETGMRIGEASALRVCDVYRASRPEEVSRLRIRTGKGGGRWIAVSSMLVDEIQALHGAAIGAARVWPVRPSTMARHLNVVIGRECARAGIPRWTTHGLRRLAVRRAAKGQIDIHAAASHFGHTVQVMLRHYAESDQEQRDAVAALSPLLPSPLGSTGEGEG